MSDQLFETLKLSNELYLKGYKAGYREGYAKAMRDASEMVDKAFKPAPEPVTP